ncbi:adenylosuccinate lyase family protein [Sphingomonas sp. H39-1-10]|uniref:class-II fumarase/aspartase family protein n=1 Tax=Sphingomonas pollutisoli TaxID=3030829 RepID=UPI0023B8EC07|nr:adenylosuccinate lyase family protein [Sphingomonas pollutisoli]MDF0490060.1 adenylosuccinate lyase family protein [Sphingomonas pollutisoli]
MIDSRIFGHLWSTPESHAIFDEPVRVDRWLDVIIALAQAQAELDLIPAEAALEIAALRDRKLPIDRIAEATRRTGHSTLGMIEVLQDLLSPSAAPYVYYGATVQDITDTSQALELAATGSLLWRDLRAIEDRLLDLAATHRLTPMAGRTHGQLGSPIPLGFKIASWADQVGRDLSRFHDGRDRWLTGQFAGAVGTLGFFGAKGLPLRTAFCRNVGLAEPAISWLSARDRFVEFANVSAMAVNTLARIANEVYGLQRREISELGERPAARTVGSITMPHKRNPENSEQIVTLAQLARAQSALLADAMIHEHERDGRAWKLEWSVFPTLAHSVLATSSLTRDLLDGLEVDTQAMARNLALVPASEHLLRLMTARLGKHVAQQTLQQAYRRIRDERLSLADALEGVATPAELAAIADIDLGSGPEMVDRVIASSRQRREAEPEHWR